MENFIIDFFTRRHSMYNLIGTTHNEMDGSFCFGFLQFLRFEWGAKGMI